MKRGETTKVELTAPKSNSVPAATKRVNLMRTAEASASSAWPDASLTASKALDGVASTRWNSKSGDDKGAWLAARWPQPVTVRQVVLHESYDRITSFQVQQFDKAKNDWVNVIAVDEKQVTVMKAGKSGKDANDGSVNPVFTVNLPSPVETTGLRIVFTTVIFDGQRLVIRL